MGIFNLDEILNPSTTITYQKVIDSHNSIPKRICFNSCHSNALRETNFDNNPDVKWALFIPFDNSIRKIFERETGLQIFPTKNGKYWCPIKKEEDYKKALTFKEKYKSNVFVRDNLDLSISLSEHMDEVENRTYLGELEYQAKYCNNAKARIKISNLIIEFIKSTPFYKECIHICAIPSSNKEKINLPMKIANRIVANSELIDISQYISWKSSKNQLKELSFEEKWKELESTDLELKIDKKIKSVILIDDLYQSGTTLQFVAMKLKEHGLKKVYGLTIVKARNDSDNN